jgi:hypothetical protein
MSFLRKGLRGSIIAFGMIQGLSISILPPSSMFLLLSW